MHFEDDFSPCLAFGDHDDCQGRCRCPGGDCWSHEEIVEVVQRVFCKIEVRELWEGPGAHEQGVPEDEHLASPLFEGDRILAFFFLVFMNDPVGVCSALLSLLRFPCFWQV